VLVSYANIGALPDLNFGDNELAISDSFFHADFWYRNELEGPSLAPGQRAFSPRPFCRRSAGGRLAPRRPTPGARRAPIDRTRAPEAPRRPAMTEAAREIHQTAINTLRFLAVDMVERAKSGHPGAPMGQASMAYQLWSRHLRFDPRDPEWFALHHAFCFVSYRLAEFQAYLDETVKPGEHPE